MNCADATASLNFYSCEPFPHGRWLLVSLSPGAFIRRRNQCATLKHMSEVGIRALKQNASAVVAQASTGETITITDRGRAVAQLTAIPSSRLQQLTDAGHARPPRCDIATLPAPESGPNLTEDLIARRNTERY
jgi:prevent-host-death family protein